MEGSIGPPGERAQLQFPRLLTAPAGTVMSGVMKDGRELLNVFADFQHVLRAVIIVGAVIIDVRKKAGRSRSREVTTDADARRVFGTRDGVAAGTYVRPATSSPWRI